MLARLIRVSRLCSPLSQAIYTMDIRGRKDRKTLFGFTSSHRDSLVFEPERLSLGLLSNVFHQDELDHRNLFCRVERENLALTREGQRFHSPFTRRLDRSLNYRGSRQSLRLLLDRGTRQGLPRADRSLRAGNNPPIGTPRRLPTLIISR